MWDPASYASYASASMHTLTGKQGQSVATKYKRRLIELGEMTTPATHLGRTSATCDSGHGASLGLLARYRESN